MSKANYQMQRGKETDLVFFFFIFQFRHVLRTYYGGGGEEVPQVLPLQQVIDD